MNTKVPADNHKLLYAHSGRTGINAIPLSAVQVHAQDDGSTKGNGNIMAMMIKMVAAAKQAEEQIRLDIGDDIAEFEDDEARQRPTRVSGSPRQPKR